jgi:hypothetical protein
LAWEIGRSLWFNSRDRVTQNLTENERRDFAEMVRMRGGRPWNLDSKERDRLVVLMKKAATGDRDASWNEAGMSLVTLLPPGLVNEVWRRLPRR